jgi:hypothetical protein
MSLTAESFEGEGAAERRAQRELTDRVGVRLVRPSKSHNLKWRTWTWRFGFRRGMKVEM